MLSVMDIASNVLHLWVLSEDGASIVPTEEDGILFRD